MEERVTNGDDTAVRPETTTAKAARGTVVHGPEAILARICKQVDALDENTKTRIVRYLAEKYEELIDG